MSGNKFGQMRNLAEIGDLIAADGYLSRVFQVEAYTHELYFSHGEKDEAILYDCYDVQTSEYALIYQEDIRVLCRAAKAKKFIEDMNKRDPYGMATWSDSPSIDYEESRKEATPVAHEKTKEERIDDLLAELSDYQTLIRMFGEHEVEAHKDRKYVRKVEEIKAKLTELTKEV